MRQKPKACMLTTDGQMLEIYNPNVVESLYQNCITKQRNDQFIELKSEKYIRFIPTHRIKEVIFYDVMQLAENECQLK